MNIYESYANARIEAKKLLDIAIKNHIRVSSPNKGDYEVEIEKQESNIQFYLQKMLEYERQHPEEFIESKPTFEKKIKQSQLQAKEKLQNLRPIELTEQILEKMITNTFIQTIESTLSTEKSHWVNAQINLPEQQEDSYTFWYCYFQAKKYQGIVDDLLSIQWGSFKSDLKRVLKILSQRNHRLKVLLPTDKNVSLYRSVELLDRYLKQLGFELITCADTQETCRKLKMELKGCIEKVIEALLETCKHALDCLDKSGHIENLELLK